MSTNSAIEWTDATWNPVRGCTKVSPGCANCYAETFAERWRGVPGHAYEQGFDLRLVPDKLNEPLSWKKPRRIFVNSMSDLFQDGVPDAFIDQVFAVMALARQHTFQVLTKRADRMRDYCSSRLPIANRGRELPILGNHDRHASVVFPLPNVWLGVSVENQRFADERVPLLLQTPAAVRFISAEPLLGPVDLTRLCGGGWLERNALNGTGRLPTADASGLERLHLVIAGGESGHGARPSHPDWFRGLRDQCLEAGVSFFFKQWGAFRVIYDCDDDPDAQRLPPVSRHPRRRWLNLVGGYGFHGERVVALERSDKKHAGRLLDGREWNELPEVRA